MKPTQYRYKGFRAVHFPAYLEGTCHHCGGIVEQDDEAVYVPKGKAGDRYFHAKCVAPLLRRRVHRRGSKSVYLGVAENV